MEVSRFEMEVRNSLSVQSKVEDLIKVYQKFNGYIEAMEEIGELKLPDMIEFKQILNQQFIDYIKEIEL